MKMPSRYFVVDMILETSASIRRMEAELPGCGNCQDVVLVYHNGFVDAKTRLALAYEALAFWEEMLREIDNGGFSGTGRQKGVF